MLVRIIAIDLAAGAVIVTLWYLWFARLNRRRATQILGWVEHAFDGHGRILETQWKSASRFEIQAKLAPSVFHNVCLRIRLFPRELPIHWLIEKMRRKQETLTFEADLDVPPSFNLEVHNHRWCGRTRRRFPNSAENWELHRTGPFVLTTRHDWQREITNMMNSLVASRECDCMTVSFRRRSPHFSATVPVRVLSPKSQTGTNIFDILRELAGGASASRF